MTDLYTDGHEILFARDESAVQDWIVYQYGESALEDSPYLPIAYGAVLTFEETFTDFKENYLEELDERIDLDNYEIPCVLIGEMPNVLDDEDASGFPRLTQIGKMAFGLDQPLTEDDIPF